MRSIVWLALISMVILSIIFACSPKVTPTSSLSTPAPIAAPRVVPTTSPEDATWQKVVEAAKKEGTVTLYSFAFTGDVGGIIGRTFEDKYGIKLDFVTGIGTTLMERIKTEQRAQKFIADTLDTSTSFVALAKDDGLTISMGALPNLREKDAWALAPPTVDTEGHLITTRPATYPSYINTNLVKSGEQPRSYRELLDPQWRGGKVTIGSPITDPIPIYVYLTTRKAGVLDDDFWRRLGRQELKVSPSVREPGLWLARGEAALSFSSSEPNVASYIKEGAAIKAIEMAEGVTINPYSNSISLIKNGAHPNAARVFVNWLLSQEGQQIYAQSVGGFVPLRRDVPDIRPINMRIEMKKPLIVGLPLILETARLQREGTLAKLLGIETK